MSTIAKMSTFIFMLVQLSTSMATNAPSTITPEDPGVRYWGIMYLEKDGNFTELKRIEIPSICLPEGSNGLNERLDQATIEKLFDLENFVPENKVEGAVYRFRVSAQQAKKNQPLVDCNPTPYCWNNLPDYAHSGQCANGPEWTVCYMYDNAYSVDGVTYHCSLWDAWYCVSLKPNNSLVGATKNLAPAGKLSAAEITSSPQAIRANAYAGSPACTVSSGKKSLAINPAKAKSSVKKTGIIRTYFKPLTLCGENCDKTIQWSITPVNIEKPSEGFNICLSGAQNECLSWNEKDGLSLITTAKTGSPTQAEKDGMTWYPGAGEIKDGAVTGYQILAKSSIEHALVVDKETGEVSVEKLYTKETTKQGELPRYTANPKYQAVWTFDQCKPFPLTPAKSAQQPAQKTSNN